MSMMQAARFTFCALGMLVLLEGSYFHLGATAAVLPSLVAEKGPETRQANRSIGDSIAIPDAVSQSNLIVVAEIENPGVESPDASGESYVDGIKLKVLDTLKNDSKEKVPAEIQGTANRMTMPETAETPLTKGMKAIFFLKKKTVIKMLPDDDISIKAVKDSIDKQRSSATTQA